MFLLGQEHRNYSIDENERQEHLTGHPMMPRGRSRRDTGRRRIVREGHVQRDESTTLHLLLRVTYVLPVAHFLRVDIKEMPDFTYVYRELCSYQSHDNESWIYEITWSPMKPCETSDLLTLHAFLDSIPCSMFRAVSQFVLPMCYL